MHTAERAVCRTIASHLGPRGLAPGTRAELRGLGYLVVPVAAREEAADAWRPHLRLVNARHLERLPARDEDPQTPVVVVGGPRDVESADARIVGRVRQPVDTLDLYPLLQRALERHPRSVPRVRSELSARCIRSDRRWPAAVISLSEGGCLLRGSTELAPGERFSIQLALPGGALVSTRARCLYRHDDQSGLAFSDTPPDDRLAIRQFVSQRLATV